MSFGTVQAEKMTTESGYSLGAGNASSFKNRLMNGNMAISQRGTSTTSSSGYLIDRWAQNITGPSSFTLSQSTTAPAGFTNSLLVTVTTGAAIGSTLNYITQAIEGNNCSDFGFGTADAKTVTISFWVRSSITGTFGGSLRNYAPASYYRGYPFTYTINAANTWEQKTVTIAGDGVAGAGQWNTNSSGSLTVFFDLGTTSAYTAAANSWITQNVVGATGTQTSLIATSGATWYVTGVQLEAGTVATSFDKRPHGTELQLCMRYYTRYSASDDSGNYATFFGGSSSTNTQFLITPFFAVPLRTANPTQTWGGSLRIQTSSSGSSLTSISAGNQQISTTGGYGVYNCASTGLGAQTYCRIEGSGDAAAFWAFSADM